MMQAAAAHLRSASFRASPFLFTNRALLGLSQMAGSTIDIRASSSSYPISPSAVVEHIVLFKVKPGVPDGKSQAMVSALRSLRSIDTVIELSAGPALAVTSSGFTHALHCRYKSKHDLASYAEHPFHLDVISKYIAPIVDERLALDWEADLHEPTLQSGYAAVRLALLKPKDAIEANKLLAKLQDYRKKFSSLKQMSFGKNFSPGRAKGFEWGLLSVFSSLHQREDLLKELDALLNSSIKPEMEDLIIMDYSVA